MTIKALIKILETHDQNAEVMVCTDTTKGYTSPASIVSEVDDGHKHFGFYARVVCEKKKKKSGKIVIA